MHDTRSRHDRVGELAAAVWISSPTELL